MGGKKNPPVGGICVTTEWLCLQNLCHLELLYFFNPWRLPVYICFSLLMLSADLHPISIYFLIIFFFSNVLSSLSHPSVLYSSLFLLSTLPIFLGL